MSHHQSSNILCVAVGSILPLLSPRINSPFPPNYFRLKNQPDSPSSPHCSWEGHGYCYPSARVQNHFPPEQNRSVESSRHFFYSPFLHFYEIYKVQLQLHISAISLLSLLMHLSLILNSGLFLTSVK